MKNLIRLIEAVISGDLIHGLMTKGMSADEKRELSLFERGEIEL